MVVAPIFEAYGHPSDSAKTRRRLVTRRVLTTAEMTVRMGPFWQPSLAAVVTAGRLTPGLAVMAAKLDVAV